MNALSMEVAWLWSGSGLCIAAAVQAWVAALRTRATDDRWPFRILAVAVVLVAVGIGQRWARLGHGPFLDMFEILASSLLSLGLVLLFAQHRWPVLRRAAPVSLSMLAVLALWLPMTDAGDTFFPPTYETPVLWFHVLLGKLFLGCALLALGLAGTQLLRGHLAFVDRLPGPLAVDALSWRLMQVALLFETMMLITGALWAQDAWGRWWAWDPLETWAFLTWLTLVGAFHARRRWSIGPRAGALMIVAVFSLAFLTFFGVPFVSVAPHKGAV
ncbi:cytochrome c biogenesis protein CcsA [Ideonella sp. A 288]|uniref:cytochrome c biogenesis protein CcsA n=1 Tax=Ideonella sp. A 288 TaxID=1962181 RepID=UPI000B4BC147|nr:cytochrome c biogenesis protein CcsA [Ideonella sp. A 288]